LDVDTVLAARSQLLPVNDVWYTGILSANEQYNHDVFQRWFHLRMGFRNNAVIISSSYSNSRWKIATFQGFCRVQVCPMQSFSCNAVERNMAVIIRQ